MLGGIYVPELIFGGSDSTQTMNEGHTITLSKSINNFNLLRFDWRVIDSSDHAVYRTTFGYVPITGSGVFYTWDISQTRSTYTHTYSLTWMV